MQQGNKKRRIWATCKQIYMFSDIADENTVVSGIEQFSICAQFFDKIDNEYIIQEDFLYFIHVEDVTGKGLANTLLIKMEDIGINLVNI